MSLFKQLLLPVLGKIAIDLFAGGGGASVGYEMATGRHVDIAVNHDPAAVELHKKNHPTTLHLVTDVFEVDPRLVCEGRDVGFLWASPDCTHHSKARGGKPIRTGRKRRALAWVVTRWAGTVKPDVIMLENVEEFAQWGPLVGKPTELRPCPKRKGKTFRKWVKSLQDLGYVVEWREIRAYVYGAPTIRKRLYLIARRDGMPIVWPDPTHMDPSTVGATEKDRAVFFRANPHLKPWRTAAECIDWSIPMCSVFATKDEAAAWGKANGQASPIRPLAYNTERRIARAVKRYVLDNPKPYLVTLNHGGDWQRGWDLDDPMRTVTSARDAHGLMVPTLARTGQSGGNGAYVNDVRDPLTTITTKAEHLVAAPVIGGVGGRAGQSPERSVNAPTGTITGKADAALFAPIVVTNRNAEKPFSSPGEPTHTITAEGAALTIAAPVLAINTSGHAGGSVDRPAATVTTGGQQILASPFFTARYGERAGQEPRCRSVLDPMVTVVNDGNGGSLAAASVIRFRHEGAGASVDRPLDTVTANSGEGSRPGGSVPLGIAVAGFGTYYGGTGGADRGVTPSEPLRTQGTENRFALWAAALGQNNGGFYETPGRPLGDPLSTILANSSGHFPLYAMGLTKQRGTSTDADPTAPLDTVSAGGLHHGLTAVHLDTANLGWDNRTGRRLDEPSAAVCAQGSKQALSACFLSPYYRTDQASHLGAPLPTATTVDRHALAAATVVRDFGKSVGGPVDVPIGALTGGGGGKAALAAALMMRHHGPVEGRVSLVRFDDWGHVVPDASVTVNVGIGAKARDGLRLVDVEAGTYYIADILMRMLQPKELYLAQGFPPGYVIDEGADGRRLTKTEQVRMVGNSVCPPVAAALIGANVPHMIARPKKEMSRMRKDVALAA